MKWANHERTVAKKLAKGKPKCLNALEHANRIISSNKFTTAKRVKKVKQNNNHFRKINTLVSS